jgi:hypothetical protein
VTIKTRHRDWSIRAEAFVAELGFRSAVVIEREACESHEPGERFLFKDLGDFDLAATADTHAIQWAQAWIDENYRLERARGTRQPGVP